MSLAIDSGDISRPTPAGVPLRVLVIIPAILAIAAMWPTAIELVRYWIDVVDYHYGFLIAAVSVIWFVKWLPEATSQSSEPAIWLVIPLGALFFLWYALWQGNSAMGAQVLTPLIVWLCVAMTIGWRAALRLAGPIGYSYFAIPLWDLMLPYLQLGTIFGAKMSLQLAGIPVTVAGAQVRIAAGTFEVAYSCSGLRYLVVSMALAVLVALVDRMSAVRAVALVAAAAMLAVLANWTRVFIVMYAGHVTGMSHYFVTDSHEGIGNIVFAVLLVVIFIVARWLREPTDASRPGVQRVRLAPRNAIVAAACASGLAVLFSALTVRATWASAAVAAPQLQPLPVAHGTWQGPLPATTQWAPRFANAHQSVLASYGQATGLPDSPPIFVYANVYAVQVRGKELVFYGNTLHSPGKWQFLRSLSAAHGTGGVFAPRLSIDEYLTDRDGRWLVGNVFIVGGSATTWGVGAQLLYGFSTLTNPAPAGVIALAVRCAADCDAEHELMHQFWETMARPLIDSIPEDMTTELRPTGSR